VALDRFGIVDGSQIGRLRRAKRTVGKTAVQLANSNGNEGSRQPPSLRWLDCGGSARSGLKWCVAWSQVGAYEGGLQSRTSDFLQKRQKILGFLAGTVRRNRINT
jgi:hypothetical protein